MTSFKEYDSIVDASSNEKQSFAPSAAVPAKKLLMGFSMAALALLGCAYFKVTSLEEKVDKMAGLRSAAGGVHPVKEKVDWCLKQGGDDYYTTYEECMKSGDDYYVTF